MIERISLATATLLAARNMQYPDTDEIEKAVKIAIAVEKVITSHEAEIEELEALRDTARRARRKNESKPSVREQTT